MASALVKKNQGGVECSPSVCSLSPRRSRHLWFIAKSHFLTVDSHHQKGVVSRAFFSGTVPPATLDFRRLEPVVQDGLNEGWQKLH